MDRETFFRFKILLLGLPGWNQSGARRALLQDCFWGHDLLNRLNDGIPGERAAVELIELLGSLESPDVDGVTPSCALLKYIRKTFGIAPDRAAQIAALERRCCRTVVQIDSVLFCAADPDDEKRIRTDREFSRIREILAHSGTSPRQGPAIRLHQPRLALRANDLTRALNETQPGLVHFAGHGSGASGICLENNLGRSQAVRGDALASLFRQFTHCVKAVVLNACFTEIQAHAIAQHVDAVIGTRGAIGDEASVAFAVGFYQALNNGCPVADAFQLGCAEVGIEGLSGDKTLLLLKTGGKVTNCA